MQEQKIVNEMGPLWERKRILFNRYLSLTRRLKAGLEDKNSIHLDGLFSQRQDCIHHIQKIDRSVAKTIKAGITKFGSISKQFKRLIEAYQQDLKIIMQAVTLEDQELMMRVQTEHKRIKTEILRMRHGRRAATGYRQNVRHAPRFLDTRR